MTSADDFHLISWRNFLGLSAVVVGVLIPVGLRYYFKRELASVQDIEEPTDDDLEREEEGGDQILAVGPRGPVKKNKNQLVFIDDEETDDFLEDYEDDEDEDIILEAGPAIVMKPPAVDSTALSSHPGRSTMG